MRNNYIIKLRQYKKCPRNRIQKCQTDRNVLFPKWYAKHCNYTFTTSTICFNWCVLYRTMRKMYKKKTKKITHLSIILLVCIEMTLNSSLDVFSYTSLLKFFNVVMKVTMYASDSVNICFSNIRLYFRIKYL